MKKDPEYPVNKELLESRLVEIEASIIRLEELQKKFSKKDDFMDYIDAYG
ncbi:hypothetical protein HYW87_00210, partial [Candidatus Roizmanbacteria bacterium]|nr:hypothetical protein [Candidatus Roizmanbacteria bacterium]